MSSFLSLNSSDNQRRHVTVDAARLMLIAVKFAKPYDEAVTNLPCRPNHPFVRYFTPEYYLHKLDFLLRYPSYFAYELIELFRLGKIDSSKREQVADLVHAIWDDKEPIYQTLPFKRFFRGAYENLDSVEAWWFSRRLIYTEYAFRGSARPQKYYFLTELALSEAERLVSQVEHAKWYDARISLIYEYFQNLTPSEVKQLQYSHAPYRQAQLNEEIPDLSLEDLSDNFHKVFGEEI